MVISRMILKMPNNQNGWNRVLKNSPIVPDPNPLDVQSSSKLRGGNKIPENREHPCGLEQWLFTNQYDVFQQCNSRKLGQMGLM